MPIKIWSTNGAIEKGALDQIENLASLPFAFHHVALMPDGHQGYGMPIGGVFASLIDGGAIIPNSVGVDIGCGMHAVKTNINTLPQSVLKDIMGDIRKAIPVGFDHRKDKQDIPELCDKIRYNVCGPEYEKARYQLGTLGGGNHFIEIQVGDGPNIWFMIHSGSRNLGKKVCDFYNARAQKMNEKYYSSIPKEWELAFFPMPDNEGADYYAEMMYCLEFARANRQKMADDICSIFVDRTKCLIVEHMDVHHNYVAIETHFGKSVYVHRKGATSAKKDEIGIIPGSQGTASYIVKGLGNPESFESCSHGSGRKMGRGEAKRSLDLAAEIKRLDDQGILHAIRGVEDLDEAPGSYKDIENVMANQKDLVDIVTKLTPLGVIKG